MIGSLFGVVVLLLMGVVVTAFGGVWGALLFVLALVVGLGGAAS